MSTDILPEFKEVNIMAMPKCCGKEMETNVETSRFLEVRCAICGDTVFLKKEEAEGPQMLDD
jgi:predicted nucleic-acid-binding Zn-ribbon protein